MIELRWLGGVLQYRVLKPHVDASGALCPGTRWTEWMDVPTVEVPQ